jgi:hypothetical protein
MFAVEVRLISLCRGANPMVAQTPPKSSFNAMLSRTHGPTIQLLSVVTLLLLLSLTTIAQKQKREFIQANALGISTQLGELVSLKFTIDEYSTEEDQAALLQAFTASGSQGLANALSKMSSKGRVSIAGTLGYDINYIRNCTRPDGSRMIRFVTDRPIAFGEQWASTPSMDDQISIGEIIVPKRKGQSSGRLLSVAKVKLDKESELEIETSNNPWELINIKLSR